MKYNKIHIIGGPGSGKTFSSTHLEKSTNLTAYDLDKVFWKQNQNAYIRSSHESRTEKLSQVLSKESWIICGPPVTFTPFTSGALFKSPPIQT